MFAEARRFDADGRHDEAIAVYRRLLAQAPDSFDGHNWIARALDLAVTTYEGLLNEASTPTQRRALESTLETLRSWKI